MVIVALVFTAVSYFITEDDNRRKSLVLTTKCSNGHMYLYVGMCVYGGLV